MIILKNQTYSIKEETLALCVEENKMSTTRVDKNVTNANTVLVFHSYRPFFNVKVYYVAHVCCVDQKVCCQTVARDVNVCRTNIRKYFALTILMNYFWLFNLQKKL